MQLTPTSTESLYQQYGPASSFLKVFNQTGTNITSQISQSGNGTVPSVDPTGGWEQEEALDVEWAHAIAPGAKIDLIECDGNVGGSIGTPAQGPSLGLYSGAATAAGLPGVTVVSMSWGFSEGNGESANDSTFVTPIGHPGITFLAISGDGGTPGVYPGFSPNVVAVGASQLTESGDTYQSETATSFPTPRTLNDGSASYSQSGPWNSQSGGSSGSYSTAAAGSDSSATWSSTITSSDQGWEGFTEVSATWVANPANATNATYSIYDGSAVPGHLLATVTVNQTKPPVGISDANATFQELGEYQIPEQTPGVVIYPPPSTTLTVVLDANSANGRVVADAIGIAKANATGGGQSHYEPEPSYQLGVQATGHRTIPDVLFDGSYDTAVYFFENGEWQYDGDGTSLSTPCWAGLFAIADQGRFFYSGTTFNTANPMQALQALYSLPSSDFHQITTGYNGLSAGPGYNEVTGLGSPMANLVVPALASYGIPTQLVITAQPPANVTAGDVFGLTVAVEGPSGNVMTNDNTTQVEVFPNLTVGEVGGTSPLWGINVATVSHGIADFISLYYDKAETIYLEAYAGSAAPAVSNRITVQPAAASSLSFTAPATATAGTPFTIKVTALDPYNNIATGYRGEVGFRSSDRHASLPNAYTFTSSDDGTHTFGGLILRHLGTQTISVYDENNPSITVGSTTVSVEGKRKRAKVVAGGFGAPVVDPLPETTTRDRLLSGRRRQQKNHESGTLIVMYGRATARTSIARDAVKK